MYLKLGRFGPYLQVGKLNVSVPKGVDADNIVLSEALVWVEEKKKADAPIMYYDELPVSKGKGRFGPFIKWNEMFINVSKKYDFDNLSESDITELIENKKRKEIEKFVHNWEEQGISVQKGRWGRHFVISGKKKIQLDKNQDPADITLEQAKEMLKKK